MNTSMNKNWERLLQIEKTIDFLELMAKRASTSEDVEFFTKKLFNLQKILNQYTI